MNTLIKLLDRLETLMLRAIPIWGTSLSIVKSEKILMMVEKIQECIPEEVRQAEQLINRRDEILAEAQRKATQMLQEAKVQAEFMLSESELLRAVHGEAERVRQQVIQDIEAMRKKTYEESESMKALAYEESKAVREGADQYADTILSSLDKSLAEFQTVVRNGQKHLKKSRSEAIQQASHIASQLRSVQQSAQVAAANPSSLQPSKAQNYLKQPVQVEV